MACEHIEIHNDLINMNESECPFCHELLVKGDTSPDLCCDEQNIDNVNGINVCRNCGSVQECISEPKYIDFYLNVYRIRRTSVYIRKYHIENTLNELLNNHMIEQLTYNQRNKVYKIFNEIGYIIHKINDNRKRIINIKYILTKIFDLMKIPYNINITQAKKTLSFYNKYWIQIMTLIGDKIEAIIVK